VFWGKGFGGGHGRKALLATNYLEEEALGGWVFLNGCEARFSGLAQGIGAVEHDATFGFA
jgi:hypothetical protein